MTTSITRANRQLWFYGLLAVVIVFAVAFPLYLTSGVAEQNRDNIRELACILISQTPDDPARPVIHDFRTKYRCPPFNPAAVGHLPTPSRRTVTRTVPKPATKTRVVPSPVVSVVPGGVRTVTVPGPRVTVTRTRTVIRVRTVPPACLARPPLPCVIQPIR